jgi:mannose-6-phosphate isomerase-like protein (cupin superfamily)
MQVLSRLKIAALVCSFLCLLLAGGCEDDQSPEKTPLLPEAGPNEKNFSPYQAQNPYAEITKGLLARTVFEAAGPPGTRVEIRDLLVGPGQSTESATMPGAAVFDVRSGSGTIVHGGQTQEFKTGTTFGISEGESFVIQNKAEIPVTIRVNLLRIEK